MLLVVVLQIDRFAVGITAKPDGPTKCKDKDRLGRRGAAVGMNFAFYGFDVAATSPQMRARSVLGMALAHEVGHLLMGPGHAADIDNLMSASSGGADDLTDGQGEIIRSSCAVVEG
ncbi:MAG: hypothetical protein ACREL7_02890 [Longimicrobiales bacterium]